MRFKALLLMGICLLMSSLIYGVTAQYNVRSLGLNIASLSIERNTGTRQVTVKTKSLIVNAIFPSLDNVYKISYDANYMPVSYTRKVCEGKLTNSVNTSYNHGGNIASQTQNATNSTNQYKLKNATRDFFSLVAMLSDGKATAGQYTLDANGSLWAAEVKALGKKQIKTELGSFEAVGYKLSFASDTHSKPPYIDMVTHNLFHKSSQVELWVDGKGVVLKANIKKGLMGASWILKELKR